MMSMMMMRQWTTQIHNRIHHHSMTKVGNWEGGEVEEYNRAITASKWAADDDDDQISIL